MLHHGDTKVFAAFIKARGEIGATVAKDAKGNYGKYATLAALTEAITGPLATHGCAIVQEASLDEAGATVETWLVHETGGIIQFAPLTLPVPQRNAQAVGSAITYARRYALAAIIGIAPDDDDGQAATDAMQRTSPPDAAARRANTPPPPVANGHSAAPGASPALSANQLKALNAIGTKNFGASWNEARHDLVTRFTKGRTQSSRELTEEEAEYLIRYIEFEIDGKSLYGLGWNEKRDELVKSATKSDNGDPLSLTPIQLSRLLAGIRARLAATATPTK